MLGPPLLPRNLEASVRDLSSARAEVRASAIEDLVRHARGDASVRERAVSLLAKRLDDDDPRVRAAAAARQGQAAAPEGAKRDASTTPGDADHAKRHGGGK